MVIWTSSLHWKQRIDYETHIEGHRYDTEASKRTVEDFVSYIAIDTEVL